MKQLNKFYKGVIFVLLSAAGFGVMPIFAKFAYQSKVSLTTFLFLRFSMAALFFFSYINYKKIKVTVSRTQLLALFILGGVCYTLQSTFYFSAVKYITPTLVALLLYTYPIFVAILSAIVDKEKLTKPVIISVGVSFSGLILFLGTSFGNVNLKGVAMGAASGFVYSCYIILGNRVVQKLPSVVSSAYVVLFASLSFLIVKVSSGNFNFQLPVKAWFPLLGIVICSTLVAIFFFFKGLEYIGSTRASIVSMIEPLITGIFAATLFNERLTGYQMLGGIMVLLGAVFIVSGRNHKDEVEEVT